MQLYDGESPINWVYRGGETFTQMTQSSDHKTLTEEPCVLFDNGVGGVYSFKTLASMCAERNIAYETAEDGYAQLVEAMSAIPPQETDAADEAIAELGILVSDLMESQAELGAMIANYTEGA